MADQENNQAQLSAQANPNAEIQDRPPVLRPPATSQIAPSRSLLTRMADSLEDEYQIGIFRSNPKLHRRYAPLQKQELFDRLTQIYSQQFSIHARAFKHVFDAFELPIGVTSKSLAAARAYITCWFWDLYVSNRECIWKMSSTAYTQHYSYFAAFSQERYDPFLQHLNAVIRPTHTPHSLEDTVWIPLIDTHPNFVTPLAENPTGPFHLHGWYPNEAEVQALIDVMDSKTNDWRTVPLSHDTTGRSMWLLDWHKQQAYAWFPMDGQYSMDDLVASHILGIPCTPNLGPRDVDEWQFFTNNVIPANLDEANLPRLNPRRFYGSAEYRSVATRQWRFPNSICDAMSVQPASKRARTNTGLTITSGSSVEGTSHQQIPMDSDQQNPLFWQYQIIDWCYHAKVVADLNIQKQNAAIRSFLFSS